MRKLFYLTIIFIGVHSQSALAQSDASHKLPKKEVARINDVLNAYLNKFNEKDLDGWESIYHFPH